LGGLLKKHLPGPIKKFIARCLGLKPLPSAASRARKESNVWLRYHCLDIKGSVLSIGSGHDDDHEGGRYRDYFKNSTSYTTSEVSAEFKCDLVLDIKSMPEIANATYDCIFCSGVLEHVDDYVKGLDEITRILKRGGVLLLGLPFRQSIHMGKCDYWRFTEHGVRHLLRTDYEIIELVSMDNSVPDFPSAYWIKARKL